MAMIPPNPAAAVAVVQPSPLNLTVQMSVERSDGESKVLMRVYTPQGLTFFYFDADNAKMIGQALVDHAREASSGLVLSGPLPFKS